ncbi:InlB B-repeat-containing protein [Lactococcus lactis]|nr:InlB B-repeat-containing protein [Lactococcus lactis]
MKKITSVLMVSALALSSVLPGVVHATENLASEKQITDKENQEVAPETREEETKTAEQSNTEEEETPEVTLTTVEGETKKNSVQTKASNEEVTVTFINGASLYKQSQVIVNNTVAYPGTPELSEGQSIFLGWYTDPEAGVPFDFNTPVTNSITLYARFSNSYLIQFKDQTGKVIDSKEIEQGQSIPETTAELTPPQGQYFSYWYVEGDTTQTPFSFETATASINLVLVPKFASERTVLFISEGTQVDPAYIQDGEKVSKPSDPTREGWTFSHWSTEQNGSTHYNFDVPVTDSLVLYAVWTPEETEYTVVFWKEKANIAEDPGTDPSNYAYAWSTKQTGQSGEKININQTTAESLVSGDSQATNALQFSEYAFSTEQTVSGNGQTIVNVYFKRVIYELEFNLARTVNVNEIIMTVEGKTYSSFEDEKYIIYAKEGQYIRNVWPDDPKFANPESTGVYQGWDYPSDSLAGASRIINPSSYFTSRMVSKNPDKKRLTLTVAFYADDNGFRDRKLYIESLNDGEEIYNGKYYNLDSVINTLTLAYSPNKPGLFYGFSYFETDLSNPSLPKDYYIRNIHTFSYNTQGGVFTGGGQTSDKKYEEKIVKPNDPVRDGYRFAGWYMDAGYNEKMNFDTFTMPDSDVTLFAKWESTQNTVRYFDGFGGTLLLQQGYSDNDDFVFPSEYVKGETYVEGKGVFNGWFWQVGSLTFEFSDSIPITKDIDLYAKWQTTGYKLTYELGGGSGTAPVDNNTYDMTTQAKLESNAGINAPNGQVFIGWKSNRDNNIYYPNAHMSVQGDTVLTAIYAAAEDIVRVNYHPGSYEGKPETVKQEALKNSTITLQEMIFTRPDKTLVGWSKAENGVVDYELGEMNFAVGTSDIDLYAVWEDKKVNITFLPGNNGSLDYQGKEITNTVLYDTTWSEAQLDTPEAQPDTGYKFAGWSPQLPQASDKLTTDRTFVAQFVELASGKVTVRYLDENGEPIADDKILEGTEGDDYDVSGEDYRLESIGDYKLIDETDNVTGTFNDDNILVIYTYQKESSANTGHIRVSYVDENGKKISEDVEKSGIVGDTYTTEEKKIKGYTFKEVKGNKAGAFTEDTQLITYIYTKDTEESGKDENENKGSDSKDSENTNGKVKDDDDSSKVTPSYNSSSKSTADAKKSKEQSLPKAGEKTEALGIMLGIMLLISVSVFVVLRPKKIK